MDKVTVLVVDDHSLIRRGLMEVLAEEDSILVVGEAADGAEAVSKTKDLAPDVVVMDLSMPNVSGLEAIQELQAFDPPPNILVLTVSESEQDLFAALEAGARGYVLKHAVSEELVRAVTHIAEGGVLVSPSMAPGMLSQFKRGEGVPAAGDDSGPGDARAGPDETSTEPDKPPERPEQPLGGIDQALGPAGDEVYEGTIRLRLRTRIPDLFPVVRFVAELRLLPDVRVLRVETTADRRADILLALRRPLPIKELILGISEVSEVGASASFPARSDDPLVYVELDTPGRVHQQDSE